MFCEKTALIVGFFALNNSQVKGYVFKNQSQMQQNSKPKQKQARICNELRRLSRSSSNVFFVFGVCLFHSFHLSLFFFLVFVFSNNLVIFSLFSGMHCFGNQAFWPSWLLPGTLLSSPGG